MRFRPGPDENHSELKRNNMQVRPILPRYTICVPALRRGAVIEALRISCFNFAT